ncbi:MAG: carbohydrate ABC transporter permease [Spirochaetota bacterium]
MIKKVLFWLITVLVLGIVVGPLLWIYLTAFKSPEAIFSTELKNLIIFNPTLQNYQRLFTATSFLYNLANTAIMSVVSTAVVMVVSFFAAYSFARWNTGGGHLLFVTISTRMFPPVVAAIPFFIMYRNMGMIDTHLGLILMYIYFNTSFATFLLFGFFREIPKDLEDAAMIDGYSRLHIFRKIVFPLMGPGLAVTAVFCLIWSWNEFFYAFLFTRTVARPVTVLISSFWGSIEVQYGPMAAGASITILPTLLAAWFMQRYIIRGLTFGAVKG